MAELPAILHAPLIASLLGVEVETVCEWFRAGIPGGRKVGRNWTIERDDFLAWYRSRPTTPRPVRVPRLSDRRAAIPASR